MIATVRMAPFDRQRLLQFADWLAVAVAASLPWSTSATSILIVAWVLAALPALGGAGIRREVASAAGGLPVLLWLFAALGMLWADVSWSDRLGGLDGYHRLLAVPLLLAQFRRSGNGTAVLAGYLASATCLLAASWAFALVPALGVHGKFPGVPVKDYIYQTDEFLICGFALLGLAGAGEPRRRAALLVLAALFLGNVMFVFSSRTGMLVAPFLVLALGWRLGGAKGVIAACVIGMLLVPALWLSSPHLRDFALQSVADLRGYFASNAVTSSGLHFEFLRRSVAIVEGAPAFGHGTGSIAEQFRQAAVGETGATAVVSVNPHDQIFAVAIQLGLIGAAVLVAMWLAHALLFCRGGWAAWTGLVVVLENVVSSAVNSHLFDFSQGWLYVFGVGAAGGMVLRQRDQTSAAQHGSRRD